MVALPAAAAEPSVDSAPDSFEIRQRGWLKRLLPHLAEDCWAALGHKSLVASEPWPRVEPALLVEDSITLPVQINGRKRDDVTVARNAGEADIQSAVLALESVKRALAGKPPKKVIVVPQRIVNVVA